MFRAIIAVRSIAGLLWLAQLVMGILFWTGHAVTLVPLHMGLGIAFVVALVLLAVLCAYARAPGGAAAWLVVMAILIAAVGMTQVSLLPGPYHWTVRVVHLVLGLAAMPMAGALANASSTTRPSETNRRVGGTAHPV